MDATTESAAPAPAGQLLATERERQGLSRVEVAQRLHMSPSQVEALETGDYSRLPKGPFLRGFVRNYAKALGLDPEALVAQLASESPAESAPRIVVPSQNIRFDPLGDRFSSPYVKAALIALVAIVLGFAAMYWWLFIRPTPPAAHKMPDMPPANAPAPVPVTPAPASAPQAAPPSTASTPEAQPPKTAPGPAPAKSEAPGKNESPAKPAAAKAPETKPAEAKPAEPKAAPAKGEAVLSFRFQGASWVEVRDAADKVVYQKLNDAGTEATVTGKPPLHVIVGNATEVSLRYNDRDFPLEPHTKVAVARFTLE